MKKKQRQEKMDRLSDLPDPLIHHIMSFLPTLDLTKISILSKRLYFLWTTFHIIDFDQSTFNRGIPDSTTDDFLDHIQNSISLRRIDTVISEFRVKLADLRWTSAADRRLDSAISFALDNGVKSLDLDLGFAEYLFPVSFASRSINVLRLKGLILDPNIILACPLLKTLSLTSCLIQRGIEFSSQFLREIELHCCDVESIKIRAPNLHSFFFDSGTKDPNPCRIDVLECENIAYLSLNNVVSGHDWVEKHTSTFEKLETLIINGCQDIHSIIIRNERVERVEIGNCPLLTSVKVMAPSLEYFQYNGTNGNMASKINFIATKSIKDLYIENAGITDEWLEVQLTTLFDLKSLRLKGCNFLKKIKVIHEKLEILELLNCTDLEEAEIDTPQLVSFVHLGNMIELEKMVTGSMCSANLFIKPWIDYTNKSFYAWKKLLSFFGHCRALTLVCNCKKELIMPKDLREVLVPPMYDLQSLEVQVKSLERIDSDLVDSLLWLSPLPNTIHISSALRTISKLQMILKFTYNETMEEQKEEEEEVEVEDKNLPFCCRRQPIKCWRHKLKRLDIQTRDKNGSAELQKYFVTNAKMLETLTFTKLQEISI